MSELSALTTVQEEILLDFQAVTTIHDRELAVKLLRQSNWSLEVAVREFLDGEERQNTLQSDSSTSQTRPEYEVSGSQRPPDTSITSVVSFPATLVWGVLGGLFTLLYILLAPTSPSLTQEDHEESHTSALKFIQEFEENYGGVRPEFFVGTYSEALSHAKQNIKYLLVILLSGGVAENRVFCQNTLSSERLVDFLRENEIVVWGGDTKDPEGYRVSKTLQARSFPFIGLIGFQSIQNGTPCMSMFDTNQGQITPDAIVQGLTDLLRHTSAELQRAQKEHQELKASRSIREQQDEAYRLGLLADREKERKAKEEYELHELQRQEAESIEKAKIKFRADRLKYRQYLITTIPKEPSSEELDTTRLSFKMPNGERVVRKFRKNEKVEDVYAFVDTLALTVDDRLETPSFNPVPEYVHKYTFRLVSPFPRSIIELDHKLSDLWPSANLLIEELDSEES